MELLDLVEITVPSRKLLSVDTEVKIVTENQTIKFKNLIGNFEGLVSLLCLFLVLTATTSTSEEVNLPWFVIITFSLGISLGICGLKFGSHIGRVSGGISVTILSLLLMALSLLSVLK